MGSSTVGIRHRPFIDGRDTTSSVYRRPGYDIVDSSTAGIRHRPFIDGRDTTSSVYRRPGYDIVRSSKVPPPQVRRPQIIQQPKGLLGPAPTGLPLARSALNQPGGLLPGRGSAPPTNDNSDRAASPTPTIGRFRSTTYRPGPSGCRPGPSGIGPAGRWSVVGVGVLESGRLFGVGVLESGGLLGFEYWKEMGSRRSGPT